MDLLDLKARYVALAEMQIDTAGASSSNPRINMHLRDTREHITGAMENILAIMTLFAEEKP